MTTLEWVLSRRTLLAIRDWDGFQIAMRLGMRRLERVPGGGR